MSYYAGIAIYENPEIIVTSEEEKTTPEVITLVASKDYDNSELYVSGRYELHQDWGYLCENNVSLWSVQQEGEPSYIFNVFNRPDLEGKLIKGDYSTGYIKSIDFTYFKNSILDIINDHFTSGEKALARVQTSTKEDIAENYSRIEDLRRVQLEAPTDEVFGRFQNQINSLYEEIAELRHSSMEKYYTSGEYNSDFGSIDRIKEFLDIAEKALAEGKVVHVFGD